METAQVRVDFTLFGENLDFNVITKSIGVQPDKTWRKGDAVGRTLITEKEDGWRISTGHSETLDIDGLVTSILDRIFPSRVKLRELYRAQNLTSELSIVIYLRTVTPSFNLAQAQLSQVAELGCSLDVDLILTA